MTAVIEPRWKPHRVGLRNVWEYDEQELHFADGRMILRGRNGSGKSNALALIFPFLIDGSMGSASMDPFGGNGGRSMKSLLLGVLRDDERSGYRHNKRLGYVWMEFTKVDSESGEAQFHTIGCGANASSDSSPSSWFFSTGRRVGSDFDLAPNNVPRTRGQLIDVLDRASVFESKEEYRRVVARDVLGLAPEQLVKLVTLVRALRKPQLAGKLDLEELSAVLSSGLPEVSENKLDDIAASLDNIGRIQGDLAAVNNTRTLINAFLPVYRRYLDSEVRQRVSSTLLAEADRTSRVAEREKRQSEHRSLGTQIASLRRDLEAARSERRTIDGQHAGLMKSDRYRDAQSLEEKEHSASRLERAAASTSRTAKAFAEELSLAKQAAERSAAELQQAQSEVDHALVRASDAG
ncbi:MAG: hypothetical protein GX868_10305, partial [Actinobacteria bacterium]|nr:hypothetical protein [Actinomycetota bacterium]